MIFKIAKAFLDGFLPVFGIAVFIAGGWFMYQRSANELQQLPLIEKITDLYKVGWQETFDFSQKLIKRQITIEDFKFSNPLDQLRPQAQKTAHAVHVNVSWDKALIDEKLKKQGWSAKKRKAANAYISYIDQYLDEAISDMYHTGVSASVTMAQAILESDAGRSKLAKTTNNHFGIKARISAAGRKKISAKRFNELSDADFKFSSPAIGVSRFHDDYKYDRFEVYHNVLDSYQRHSRLLQNDCKKARKGCYAWIWKEFPVQKERIDISKMASVFQSVSGYAPKDFFGETLVPYYAAQAAGLKMAGYATSKTYHKKLVYLIETYELWRLDLALLNTIS